MEIVKTSYIVWYWDSIDMRYRIGKPFTDKVQAEKFADSLKHWEYIGITYSVKIYKLDDVA